MSETRKSILLRIAPELWDELNRWARDELRSVNAQIEYLLRNAVNRRTGRAPDRSGDAGPDALWRVFARVQNVVRELRAGGRGAEAGAIESALEYSGSGYEALTQLRDRLAELSGTAPPLPEHTGAAIRGLQVYLEELVGRGGT
jgi:hypothetical protein